MRPTTALRKLIAGEQIVVAPGVYDGMSARLVQRAGFAAAYATGGGIARSMGYPDLGLLGLTEVAERLSVIVEHAGVPVIADADTGYGNTLNVRADDSRVRARRRGGAPPGGPDVPQAVWPPRRQGRRPGGRDGPEARGGPRRSD